MEFYIGTEHSSGMKFKTKEEFLKEIELMVDCFIKNDGSYFEVTVDSDVSCFDEEE